MCVSEKHSLFTTEHNCKDKIFKLYFKIGGILYEKNIDNGKNLYQKKQYLILYNQLFISKVIQKPKINNE
jgi:hypothetical protein